MRSRGRVNPIVVGIDGSSAAINAAASAVDEAISRRFRSDWFTSTTRHPATQPKASDLQRNDELPQQNRIVAVVDRYPDGDDVIHHALDEATLRSASLLVLGVRRWKVGARSGFQLDRRLERWLPSYPDVEVHTCITDSAAEYLVTREEHVKLVVTGSADAGMLTRLVGPHGHALATYPNCSVLLVRYDDQD